MTDQDTSLSLTKGKALVFRIHENGPDALRDILLERGWEEFNEGEHAEHEWNMWWRGSRFRASDYENLLPWQRLNHFPKTFAVTKKDMLARNMRRMRGVYGPSVYNFTPLAFNLPNDYTKFVAEYTQCVNQQQEEQHEANVAGETQVAKRDLWICKPADLSRGRGIFIFKDLNELTYDCAVVVQKYIPNPLLIGGYKFDLRIYVAVTSFHPLNIYVYQEGIARFSTEKFDLTATDNVYAHLTNTSINKNSPSYIMDKERVGPGCKWSFSTLRNYFNQQDIHDEVLWQRINNIITLTLLAQATTVPKVGSCFELFGFDVLVDDNLKPWLLEVNFSPALELDCQIDYTVKKPLLNHLIDLLDYKESDSEHGGETYYKHAKLKQQHAIPKKNTGFRKIQASRPAVKKPIGASSSRIQGRQTTLKSSLSIKTSFQKTQNRNPTNLKTAAGNSSQRSTQSSSRTLCNDRTGKSKKIISKPTSTSDLLDDECDAEVAAVCSKSISETTLNEASSYESPERRSRLSLPPRRIRSKYGLENSRTGSVDTMARNVQKFSNSTAKGRMTRKYITTNLNDAPPGPQCNLSETQKFPSPKQNRPSQNIRSTSQSYRGRSIHIASRSSKESSDHETTQSGNHRDSPRNRSNPVMNRTKQIQQPKQAAMGRSKLPNVNTKTPRGWPRASLTTQKQPSLYQGGRKFEIPPIETKAPPKRVSDFLLIFPFSDATRRASITSLDIRIIIKEIQSQLRRTICKVMSTRKPTAITAPCLVPVNKEVVIAPSSHEAGQTVISTSNKQGGAQKWVTARTYMETMWNAGGRKQEQIQPLLSV